MKWLRNGQLLNLDDVEHYASETSDDQRQHLLTVNLIRNEDAGEYGVSVNDEYIPVTKLTILPGLFYRQLILLMIILVEQSIQIIDDILLEDVEPQISEIHDDDHPQTTQSEWEIVEEQVVHEEKDGPQINVDLQLVKRDAIEHIQVEITTNDFDESQKHSLLGTYLALLESFIMNCSDLSSQNEDDTFEILEAESKPQDLDFEMVSRPDTGAELDLISVSSLKSATPSKLSCEYSS